MSSIAGKIGPKAIEIEEDFGEESSPHCQDFGLPTQALAVQGYRSIFAKIRAIAEKAGKEGGFEAVQKGIFRNQHSCPCAGLVEVDNCAGGLAGSLLHCS